MLLGGSLRVQFPVARKSWWQESGAPGHAASIEEARSEKLLVSAHFLLFYVTQDPAHGMVPPHLEWVFPFDLTQSRSSLQTCPEAVL